MISDEQKEAWEQEFIELEMVLTVFELLTLIKVATNQEELGPLEPVWPVLGEAETPLWHAPFRLSEGTLLQLSQQHRLIRLGLLEMYADKGQVTLFRLTEKGKAAANWWMECLEDMGFVLRFSLNGIA